MALVARTGRERQRYEGPFRLVAGCIPYRLKQGAENRSACLVNQLEVLMISTPKRSDLVFPKGGWEDDETVDEAACREALEEAGVRGVIHETILGVWEFRSKSKQNSCGLEGSCRGYMFALEVTEELESWPEHTIYKRRWVSVKESLQLCRYDWMREALAACVRVVSAGPALPSSDLSEPSKYGSVKPAECQDSAMDATVDISSPTSSIGARMSMHVDHSLLLHC